MVCLPLTGKKEKELKTIGEEILSLQLYVEEFSHFVP